jgi:hypothetical protein
VAGTRDETVDADLLAEALVVAFGVVFNAVFTVVREAALAGVFCRAERWVVLLDELTAGPH